MKKLIATLQHVLAVILFSALGMGSLAQAEEVDLAQLMQSTTDESIAVNPRWVELPGGGRTQFEVFGESGPFVFLGPHMFLHPITPGSSAFSQGYVDGLSDRYRVIVADWPRGMGQSSTSASWHMTADNAVADILAIADAAGAETFAWWGYSYGGAVGLQLAARTDRVSALVVGGFPPLWQPLSDMLLALHQMEDQLELAGLTGESSFLLNQDSIHFYTSIAQINQLDLLDKITAPRMVYHDVDDTVGIGGMVHDLSRRTREGADTLKARGWEIQWMETGMAHYGLRDYQKNLDAFAPFLDRVLLGKAVVDVVLETAVGNITLPIPGAKKAAKNPEATITFESGETITLELYPDAAPQSVRNFIYLANQGFFDNGPIWRVEKDGLIQGGAHQADGSDGAGYGVNGEYAANGFENPIKFTPGTIGYGRLTNNDGGGAYFITVTDMPRLDGNYAAFGRVTDGLELAKEISRMEAEPIAEGMPIHRAVNPVMVSTIRVDTFGVEYPEPEKLPLPTAEELEAVMAEMAKAMEAAKSKAVQK